MKILITGAWFIGYKMVKVLSDEGAEIVGLDSINDYYDVDLKYARLADTGIIKEEVKDGILVQSHSLPGYRFIRMDLTDREGIDQLFRTEGFTHVLNPPDKPECVTV